MNDWVDGWVQTSSTRTAPCAVSARAGRHPSTLPHLPLLARFSHFTHSSRKRNVGIVAVLALVVIIIIIAVASKKGSSDDIPSEEWHTLRLPASISPLHYSLNLHPNLTTFTFAGDVTIDLQVRSSKMCVLHADRQTTSFSFPRSLAPALFLLCL